MKLAAAFLRFSLFACSALVGPLAPTAQAQCHYTATPTGLFQCPQPGIKMGFTGTGINNEGSWAGYRRACPPNDNFFIAATAAVGRTPQNLALPPGAISARTGGVNDIGGIVGDAQIGNNNFGVVWTPQGPLTLPLLPGGGECVANAVNNSWQVVGSRTQGEKRFGFFWQAGAFVDIDPGELLYCEPFDVSESGVVVGRLGSRIETAVGFRWSEGRLEILDSPPGALTSYAVGINASGLIVGQGLYQAGKTLVSKPVAWSASGPAVLTTEPSYAITYTSGVNDSDVVIGVASLPASPQTMQSQVALAWLHGNKYRLQDFVVGTEGLYVLTAISIGNDGQILCLAVPNMALDLYVLTPVNPPMQDLDGDCHVGSTDLAVFLALWNTAGPRGDFDSNGVIDARDLADLLGAWSTDL